LMFNLILTLELRGIPYLSQIEADAVRCATKGSY
jgi:hypothetical protein